MDIVLVIGIMGMLALLMAFVLNLFRNIGESSLSYALLNLFGGGLLVYYAFALKSYPFLILESVWDLSALYKLMVLLRK